MLQLTNLSGPPFGDDYDPSKNFHRILFRPGKTVQARELTQAQTILQEQIDRLGRHLFQEGSVVIPGGINADPDKDTVSVSIGGVVDQSVLAANSGRIYLVSATSGIEAKMSKYVPAVNTDPDVFAIDYVKTATNGTTRTFTNGESVKLIIRQDTGDVVMVNMVVLGTFKGTYVSVLPGVYFIRGHLVQCNAQDILATPFRNDQTVHVGFNIIENIVTEATDSSLLSNAQGYPNFKAPGAARLQIQLTLNSYVGQYNDNSFVEIVTFENGELLRKVVSTDYSVLLDALAQRTYETNGNFTVAPIPLTVYNHMRNDDFRDGLYPPAMGGDASKLVYRLGRGVAYTSGFRGEIQNYYDIVADKAIDTKPLRNVFLATHYGSYFIVNAQVSVPFIDIKKRLTLQDVSNATIGSFLVRSVKRENSTKLRLYVMDIQMNGSHTLGEAKKVVFTDSANNISLTLDSTNIYDSSQDSLIFKLPFDAVKSLSTVAGSNTSYSVVRNYDLVLNSSGVGTVSLPANEYFPALNDFDYIAALSGSGTPGTQFPLSSLSLSGAGNNKTLTVTVGSSYSGQTVRVIAPVFKAVTVQKTKTKVTRTQDIVFTNQSSSILDRCDVINVSQILLVNTDLTTTDVTSLFNFRTGSRPNWYENGSIYTKDGTKFTGTYRVTYDYFNHSTGDYFTIDSYGGMLREDIPQTTDTSDRVLVNLADCIDYRPLRDASTASNTDIGNFTSVSWVADMIDPSDNVSFDVTYYTNRIDLVYSAPDGSFNAVRGIPDDSPQCPTAPNNGMPLYQVYIPAYTVDLTLVKLSTYDNRRYTMRDIGKLETRIGNLEYYTSLTLLEISAERSQVIDPVTGLSRFKNGFTADNFQSTNLADVYDPLWQASIDFTNGLLLGSYQENGVDLIPSSGSNYKQGITLMKDYTVVPSISQTLATETVNINPYAVYTWSGVVELFPKSDFWKESVYLPPVIKTANSTAIDSGNSASPTQQQIDEYNNSLYHLIGTPETRALIFAQSPLITTPGALLTWQTQDGTVVTIPNTIIDPSAHFKVPTWAMTGYTMADVPGYTPGLVLAGFPKPPAGIPIASPETANRNGAVTWGITGSKTSTSIVNNNFDDLINTAVIPWMRSIQINFNLTGFRPFTKLYAFFNGVNVDAYITQTKPIAGTLGVNVVVDAAGSASGTFLIPSAGDIRFPVGQTTLRFTDDPQNGTTNAQSFTNGETIFTSGGTLETRRITTVQTAVTSIEEEWGWVAAPQDPIAQTFYVSDPKGIWIPKVDLYFAKKAKSIPVRIQIRSVVAGLPTNIVCWGSNVTLNPSQVNVSSDASIPTSFVFDDPIFLEGATEYALVVLADTQEYEVYVATMGQRVLGRNLNVAEQPNIGVFLTSSNASTWTPEQLRDLTFVVHKCQFSTTTSSQVIFNGFAPAPTLTTLNPLKVTSGSNTVRLNVRSHGLKTGDTVNILSIEGGAGIPQSELLGNHTVLSYSLDWITFTTTTNANADAAIGGPVLVQAYYPISEFKPKIKQLLLPDTNIVWEYQYVDQATRATSSWLPFTNTDYTQGVATEGIIRQTGDFKVRATMTTNDPNLTPQIHTHGTGLRAISRRLTNDPLNPAYNYVSKSVKFDTASTSTKIYIGVNLPGSTTMKVFYKLLTSGSDNTNLLTWVEASPKSPLVNQAKGFTEYEYDISSTTPYIGYKLMVQFFGPNPVECPICESIRSISLA